MSWYAYLSYFGAGLFLMNALPHLVHGVSGRRFQSPFADPPGRGLSSASTNVVWGLFNLAVGLLLAQVGGHPFLTPISNAAFFAGMAVMALALGAHFSRVHESESD